eukprot:3057376-Rhodomonas_salina.4
MPDAEDARATSQLGIHVPYLVLNSDVDLTKGVRCLGVCRSFALAFTWAMAGTRGKGRSCLVRRCAISSRSSKTLEQ